MAQQFLPISAGAIRPSLGAYVASAWLILIAVNLALGGHFDIAVRDGVLAISAYALARFEQARAGVPAASSTNRRGLVTAAVLCAAAALASPTAAADRSATLHQDMRKLWTDHIVWTRDYIVAAVDDRPDAQAAATRLMKNQEDIGSAVEAYYGQAAGQQLTSLLKQHIAIAVDLIKAAKKGDQAAQKQASDALVSMMKAHLSTTTDEVVARLKHDYIIKQFPDRFTAS